MAWLGQLCAGLVLVALVSQIQATRHPKKYVVDLDQPEEQRWQHIALDNKWIIQDVHKILATYVPESLIPVVTTIAGDLDTYIMAPYANEMRGIAKALNGPVGDVVAANLIYDVSAFCTSIVSQDMAGQIWHSRNLDYAFTDMLKNITIFVDFHRAGQTVYSAVTYAGYVGILTGQRPKAFSITVDERDQGNILENLLMGLLFRDIVPVSFLVRDSLANDTDFQSSVSRLSRAHTTADVYFIVAGMGPAQGAVVTKGRIGADDVWYLSPGQRWFLVETNYDHWKAPPASDNRRDPAIKAMTTMGQTNIGLDALFNVMSTPPVLNNHTIYTIVMTPANPGVFTAWVRD